MPTKEELQAIVRKIQNLLALGRNPNEFEALAASRKAQELMLQHNLELADLAGGSAEEVSFRYLEQLGGNKTVKWKSSIAVAVSQYTMCHAFWTNAVDANNKPLLNSAGHPILCIKFIGRPTNLLIGCNMYQYLVETVNQLTEVSLERFGFRTDASPRQYANNFRNGCAIRLQERINALRIQQQQEGIQTNDVNLSAIVVRSAYERELAAIEAFMGRKPKVVDTQTCIGTPGFAEGQAAGDRVSLNPQLGAKPLAQLYA